MKQLVKFSYAMSVLALFVISIAKYNGALNDIPDSIFWILYVPMLFLVIVTPFLIEQESKATTLVGEKSAFKGDR